MATFAVTTTARQDQAAKRMADAFNSVNPSAPPLTVGQFAQQEIQAMFDRWVTKTERDVTITKADAYNAATPEDKAAVDAILAKYQTAAAAGVPVL